MKISEVAFLPIKPTEKGLIGFASCLFNDSLSLNNIAVYTRPEGGYRLVFPDKILPNGAKINIFHPITREAGDELEQAVSQKIEDVAKKVAEGANGTGTITS